MKQIRFSENLKELRKEKRITQGALAKVLGVDQRTISAWENEICEPNYATLLKLCEFFDESIEDMLT
ncbi:MAG: helix-turn-helix transcriptional regulator [Clostridia bacterium]|nr:helix-turn-helix transcriptional regulator [Clostridia bacterium]